MALINSQDVFESLNLSSKKIAVKSDPCDAFAGILKLLRIKDEQDAINRYDWALLPSDLNALTIERMLWYKRQVALFYFKTLKRFFILPFVGHGCDYLGRPTSITPIQWGSSEGNNGQIKEFVKGLEFKPIYDLKDYIDENGIIKEEAENCCVILKDYTDQLSFTGISRAQLNDPLLQVMAEAFPFARTNLINNSGVKGVRVNSEEEFEEVQLLNKSIVNAAKSGQGYLPIIGQTDFQELGGPSALKCEDYLVYMQALDNLRLSLYGLKSGGIFEKKSQMLQSEYDQNASANSYSYEDGLKNRQQFCILANIVFADYLKELFWCEGSEIARQADLDLNGVLEDEKELPINESEVSENE